VAFPRPAFVRPALRPLLALVLAALPARAGAQALDEMDVPTIVRHRVRAGP
jgi:hypothetical protein